MSDRSPGTCPACDVGRPGRELAAPVGTYLVCDRCGTATLVDPPNVTEHYRDYFPDSLREDSPLLARRYADIVEKLEREAPGRRLLEVGCGNGQLLAVAAERGWHVAGTELSRAQVEHGKDRGLDVVYGDLAREPLFPDRHFDAAVMIEVLEHLPDPEGMLKEIARHLVPGAVLYGTTPNFAGLSRRIMDGSWSVLNREHVTLLTPKGIRALMRRTGFDELQVETRNVNPAELARHLRGRCTGPSDGSGAVSATERVRSGEEVRDRIEGSRTLRLAKGLANRLLNLAGLGDGIVVRARRSR